jgi:hypothetical protein
MEAIGYLKQLGNRLFEAVRQIGYLQQIGNRLIEAIRKSANREVRNHLCESRALFHKPLTRGITGPVPRVASKFGPPLG